MRTHRIAPAGFPLAGACVDSWRRYDVTDADLTTAVVEISGQDNVMVFPLGGGLRYEDRSIATDARVTHRPALDEDLIVDASRDHRSAAIHTWNASAHVGGNF